MIEFFFETDFEISNVTKYSDWVNRIITSEDEKVGDVSYIFCDDSRLVKINQEYLKHDTYTDIITFDYTDGGKISGDIFISVDRVKENAERYHASFVNELHRVMAHGILHLCGYGDKTEQESSSMREKEEEKIKLFHVEH